MSTMPAGSNSATHPRGPQSKCRAFREALTSSTPAWPFGTFSSAKRCGQRICHRVLPPALASLPATPLYCSAKSGFIPGAHGGVYAATTPASTPPDDAQSPRQPRRSWNGVQSSRVYHCVFRTIWLICRPLTKFTVNISARSCRRAPPFNKLLRRNARLIMRTIIQIWNRFR